MGKVITYIIYILLAVALYILISAAYFKGTNNQITTTETNKTSIKN